MDLQPASLATWASKYQLKDQDGKAVDHTPEETLARVAKALAGVEKPQARKRWEREFLDAMHAGAYPAGRILSNAGAGEHKPSASTINCMVSDTIEDSMAGIMRCLSEAAMTLRGGSGIGYDFSTLRPKGAAVRGAGAKTSGPLPFMDVYDAMCATVSSAGGRRGAQMATMAVDHPDIVPFIKAKREAGRLRHFNLSVLMTDEFLRLVDEDDDLLLRFGGKVHSVVGAQRLYDLIMRSTYEYAEPGVLFVDRINEMNNLWFCEDIRATNPCGEVPLPPYGCCLLGSLDLRGFVMDPFSAKARFDLLRFKQVVEVFTRMLDNVVELANLPLEQQTRELNRKRRHGMGYFGLGSALAMLGLEYGSPEAVSFTEMVTRELALTGWRAGVELAREKGPAPIMEELFDVTDAMRARMGLEHTARAVGRSLFAHGSRYMARIGEADPELLRDIATHGARFTHHTAIAPTGSLALSFGNNASNGIEPSFEHCYYRNIIVEGKATKERVEVRSAEALAFKERFGEWPPEGKFISANDISPERHIDMQAAAQRWVDASISKTISTPTNYPFEDFKRLYRYAYAQGLKGCATFRYNPEHHQGVLVKKDDAGKTVYRFTLADGSTVDARGDETLRYDGAEHVAANLYEAIKEGNYGRL